MDIHPAGLLQPWYLLAVEQLKFKCFCDSGGRCRSMPYLFKKRCKLGAAVGTGKQLLES